AGKIITLTNNAGGILGGISNGMPVVLRVAFKPTPSIAREQKTVDLKKMSSASLEIRGRHDACIVPRAVPVVEAMMAVTLCDFSIRAGVIPRVIK
ncbi:MAG: chorismate synthase, partial [Chloroflexi bacterium]|nr:chorismate synthase [Chloroflexota bacterium]